MKAYPTQVKKSELISTIQNTTRILELTNVDILAVVSSHLNMSLVLQDRMFYALLIYNLSLVWTDPFIS